VTPLRTTRPVRNWRYLAWIRTLPCVVCGARRGIEASHTGPHGLGQKSPDSSAIPLCTRHHRTGRDSYHKLGPRKFAELHGLNIRAIVDRLNLKPFIRIETGLFIGCLEDQQYFLGTTEEGIANAVRKMTRLCEEDRGCRDLGRADSPALVNTSAIVS
jgi:hypothetical protein